MAPKTLGPRLLADADDPIADAPAVVADPVEEQDPLAADEAQVRDAHVTVGVPPLGAGGDEVERAQLRGDAGGLGEQPLEVVLTALGPFHLEGAGKDGLTVDVGLAFPQEA